MCTVTATEEERFDTENRKVLRARRYGIVL